MSAHQMISTVILMVVLLGVGGFFFRRHLRTLRHVRTDPDLSDDDRAFARRQVVRRLVCSALMIALAVILGGSFFLEGTAQQLADQIQTSREAGQEAQLNPEQRRFSAVYLYYWMGTLLVLLSIIALAVLDIFSIRQYRWRQYRQIQEGRRAMIEGQLARLRSRRNGHG